METSARNSITETGQEPRRSKKLPPHICGRIGHKRSDCRMKIQKPKTQQKTSKANLLRKLVLKQNTSPSILKLQPMRMGTFQLQIQYVGTWTLEHRTTW